MWLKQAGRVGLGSPLGDSMLLSAVLRRLGYWPHGEGQLQWLSMWLRLPLRMVASGWWDFFHGRPGFQCGCPSEQGVICMASYYLASEAIVSLPLSLFKAATAHLVPRRGQRLPLHAGVSEGLQPDFTMEVSFFELVPASKGALQQPKRSVCFGHTGGWGSDRCCSVLCGQHHPNRQSQN